MADVVVECFAEVIWSWNGGSVSVFLVHGGCFASGFDRVSTDIADFYGVGNDLLHLVKDVGYVAKTGTFLEVFGSDGHVFGDGGADSV